MSCDQRGQLRKGAREKLHFCFQTEPPLKTRQNEPRGKKRCVLRLTYLSVNHMKSFQEIGAVVQHGLEYLRETAS